MQKDVSEDEKLKVPLTVTVKIDLILGAAVASPPAAANLGPTLAETVKYQEGVDKLIQGMQGASAVKLGDLTRLSATLGALTTSSMNFAPASGG